MPAPILTVALLAPTLALPPSGAVPPDVARQVIGEGLANPQGMAALSVLTEEIGPRLSGSTSARRAWEWAAAEFKRRGVPKVTLEEFTMDAWERGSLSLDVVKPGTRRSIRAVATAYSPGTGGPREGPLVDAGTGTATLVGALGDKVKGAIVLIGPANETSSPSGKAGAQILALKKAGALAIVLQWGRSTVKTSARPPYKEIPTVVVSREDGDSLRRLAAAPGGARLRITMTSRTRKGVRQSNVVAEIPGREKPDEIVVVGAHLDSWDLGRGATDNGFGSAEVLEAARLVAQAPRPPRRTVRFVLFMAEEQGLLGSEAYVKRHADEMPRTVLMVNEDFGPGGPSGLELYMRPEGRFGAEDLARPAAALGLDRVIESDDGGSDSWPFLQAGVPAAALGRKGYDYWATHHTPEDTLDKVPPEEMARFSTALALVAYGAAERPERIAPHLGGDELKRRFPGK